MKNQISAAFHSGKFVTGFTLIMLLLITLIVYPIVITGNPIENITSMFAPPSQQFPLGADNFGRNELSELIAGAKNSLFIGLIAGAIATGIGLVVGLVSGYMGGTVDNVLTAATNMFIVIPSFIILILISVSISSRSYVTTAVVIGFTSWPWTARGVRAPTVSLRKREHVNLAKMSGYSIPKIICKEILPYVASYVMMAFILQVACGILSEAQISMLGLGPQNTVTLGLMMFWSTSFESYLSGAWWAFIPVILMITLITFSLNMINSGLDQLFNPQIRG